MNTDQIVSSLESPKNKELIRSVVRIGKDLEEDGLFDDPSAADSIYEHFNEEQRMMFDLVDNLDLNEIDRTVEKVESFPALPRIDVLKRQSSYFVGDKKQIVRQPVFLPRTVMSKFKKMRQAFRLACPGKDLILESGFRHPVEQKYLILFFLAEEYDFGLKATLRRVLPPTYSQHCSTSMTAVDLCSTLRTRDDYSYSTTFSTTQQYKWLKKHAGEYGFYESYQPGNKEGILWEPWHWQYRGVKG